MIRFKQYLKEGKQVGTIYHFTNVANAWVILNSKELLANMESNFGFGGGGFTISRGREGVSFTRNPNLKAHKLAGGDGSSWGSIRLAFDGNKLSNKYKIEPYLDRLNPDITRKVDQAEEIIKQKVVKIGNTVKQVDLLLSKEWADRVRRYMNSISPFNDLDAEYERSDLADFIRWVRKQKIKINIVNNFNKKVS